MSDGLHLTISTPRERLVDADGIVSVRAADDGGSFGILPRHADFLTMLAPCVIRWRDRDRTMRFCAVRGGVLTVSRGREVAVACREALVGDRLEELEAAVAARRARESDADRVARVAEMRLHTRAMRQIMRYLVPGAHDGLETMFGERER
ncbi:MAG: F0F1 ATP synthase subunit epsilon [Xanthomonadaceae bacterium]|nr:F0F1 ATP synthase subunit epsilon [Xanthomonadaceae bacterium]MDE2561560.1 F0F1 ATP synthase subunit epsilon [Sphingomonadales bacterium]MDE2568747.1 F0F1 ATP synthase subunit epsilon [Sphingomonadales bacterium]